MELWGEISSGRENWVGVSQQERDLLGNISRPLPVEGPKFHQPLKGLAESIGSSQQGDPLVINTIQLLSHKRALDRLLETVETYKQAIASGSLDKMPSLAPLPPRPNILTLGRSQPLDYYSRDSSPRLPQPVRELSETSARAGLRRAVVRLCAHQGAVTAHSTALNLLIDSAEHFLVNFCKRLRESLDHSLCLAPHTHTGWADVLEKVLVETGDPGGVLALGEYYEESVIERHHRLAAQVREREALYSAELPGEPGGTWPNMDEIPEMHFPSSEEGCGTGGDVNDHATPTLDVGMQMLQSLEASGDLDTPLSVAESEALSGYSATSSPQVVTPGRAVTPHSPAEPRTKKRRRSGGKFV